MNNDIHDDLGGNGPDGAWRPQRRTSDLNSSLQRPQKRTSISFRLSSDAFALVRPLRVLGEMAPS